MDTENIMLLKDKVILITGAGGGLGSTAALALAQQGASLILLDKLIPKLEVVYDAIIASGAPTPALYPFDLAGASETDYYELAQVIEARYGALHGLLHSAVEFKYFSPLSHCTTQDWAHSLNVNLSAAFLLTRVLLPLLQNSDNASVVFTSDSAVREARAYVGVYGIAKIALEGMAKIFAEELAVGQKVRVNTLVPGKINSPLRKKAYPAEDKSRLPIMDSLAPVYSYLFSQQSIGITGQVIDAQTFNLAL